MPTEEEAARVQQEKDAEKAEILRRIQEEREEYGVMHRGVVSAGASSATAPVPAGPPKQPGAPPLGPTGAAAAAAAAARAEDLLLD